MYVSILYYPELGRESCKYNGNCTYDVRTINHLTFSENNTLKCQYFQESVVSSILTKLFLTFLRKSEDKSICIYNTIYINILQLGIYLGIPGREWWRVSQKQRYSWTVRAEHFWSYVCQTILSKKIVQISLVFGK